MTCVLRLMARLLFGIVALAPGGRANRARSGRQDLSEQVGH